MEEGKNAIHRPQTEGKARNQKEQPPGEARIHSPEVNEGTPLGKKKADLLGTWRRKCYARDDLSRRSGQGREGHAEKLLKSQIESLLTKKKVEKRGFA